MPTVSQVLTFLILQKWKSPEHEYRYYVVASFIVSADAIAKYVGAKWEKLRHMEWFSNDVRFDDGNGETWFATEAGAIGAID